MTKTLRLLAQTKMVARFNWLGGYTHFAVMNDGGCLCAHCLRSEWRNVCHSTMTKARDGWQVAAIDCTGNSDSTDYCDHCGKEII